MRHHASTFLKMRKSLGASIVCAFQLNVTVANSMWFICSKMRGHDAYYYYGLNNVQTCPRPGQETKRKPFQEHSY